MSIFDPGKAEAFARQNEKNLREHLRSLTVEKSIALGEMLIDSYFAYFNRGRSFCMGRPMPTSISRMLRRNGRE